MTYDGYGEVYAELNYYMFIEAADADKTDKTLIKVNNREYEIIGAETVQDLRVKDMLSSTRGYTTFDPKGKIHSFQ